MDFDYPVNIIHQTGYSKIWTDLKYMFLSMLNSMTRVTKAVNLVDKVTPRFA